MAGLIATKIRIRIQAGGEDVTLICRQPTSPEMSAFLSQRFTAQGRKVKSNLYAAREELMRKVLVDVENAEFETRAQEMKPLNAQTVLTDDDKTYWGAILRKPVSSWIDLIPLSWLSSGAMHFEDAAPEEDGEGN